MIMKQHRGMGHYQANPGPTCRRSYDVAAILSQGNFPSCIALSDSHDVTWGLGCHSGQRAWRKRKRRPYAIFEALNHTESHWISWTRFLFSVHVTLFLFHPMELTEPSHPQLSTSASGETWGTNGAFVNLEFFDAFDDGFGSCGSFGSWPSWFWWKFRKGICLWLWEASGSPNGESGFEFYVETETRVSKKYSLGIFMPFHSF